MFGRTIRPGHKYRLGFQTKYQKMNKYTKLQENLSKQEQIQDYFGEAEHYGKLLHSLPLQNVPLIIIELISIVSITNERKLTVMRREQVREATLKQVMFNII